MTPTPTPSATTTDPAAGFAWWPADWSQFIPDLVITAVVGALVGLGLWLVQAKATQRERRRLAESAWAHSRPLILNAARRPLVRAPRLDFWKDEVERVLAAAKGVDLVSLQSALPENAEVASLAALQREEPVVRRATEELSAAVARAIGQLPNVNTGSAQRALRSHFAAWLLKVDADVDGFHRPFPVEAYVERVGSLSLAATTKYRKELETIEAAYATLHAAAD